MSTLKANAINNISASVGGITIDSSGTVSGSLPSPNRNLLYNGAMQVSQRGTSTTGITATSYNTADRWQFQNATMGTWTQDIQNDAPTGSGFRNSLRMLCTTADASPAAGDNLAIVQSLEGQDLQRVRKGTASAQKLTLSFWVKSNVTGTYIAEMVDVDNTRQVSASYTISASATWERKTITFPADTTGAFDNNNDASLRLRFWLGAGSDFTSGTLNTSWASTTNANRAVGQTNLAAAINNYWQVTGVQLEVGDAATDFEFKSFGQELRECQRYYWRPSLRYLYSNYGIARAQSTTLANALIILPVTMRRDPTLVESSTLGLQLPGLSTTAVTSISLGGSNSTENAAELSVSVASGLTSGTWYFLTNNNNASGFLALGAEL